MIKYKREIQRAYMSIFYELMCIVFLVMIMCFVFTDQYKWLGISALAFCACEFASIKLEIKKLRDRSNRI